MTHLGGARTKRAQKEGLTAARTELAAPSQTFCPTIPIPLHDPSTQHPSQLEQTV